VNNLSRASSWAGIAKELNKRRVINRNIGIDQNT